MQKLQKMFITMCKKIGSLSAPTSSSPQETVNLGSSFAPAASSSVESTNDVDKAPLGVPAQANTRSNGFDEFDPRGSVSAAPPAATSHGTVLGSAPISDQIYSLTLVPITMIDTGLETDLSENSGSARLAANSSASAGLSQSGEDPFGDSPFKATRESFRSQQHSFAPDPSFNSSISIRGAETLSPAAYESETTTSFDFDGSFGGVAYNPILNSQQISFASSATLTSEVPMSRPNNDVQSIFGSQTGAATFVPMQQGQPIAPSNVRGSFLQPSATILHTVPLAAPVNMQTNQLNLLSEAGLQVPINMEFNAPTSSLSSVKSAPSKDKFEMKSMVWANTLSRGFSKSEYLWS